jgi:predicted nucleotide-binding protein
MATRKNKPREYPPITELMISKTELKSKIQERIEEGERLFNFQVKNQQEFDNNQEDFYRWNDYNLEYLKQSFNNPHNEYKKAYDDAGIWGGFMFIGGPPPSPAEKLQEFKEKIESKVKNLKNLLAKAELLKCTVDSEINSPASGLPNKIPEDSKNIFIVHGHDERTKIEVARTVEKLGLNPIILHEKANEGKTIIEKFEVHSNVGFAIVLMTCDDLGKSKTSNDEKYRARQNVILEMGYFTGKLGRSRVFPLFESGVELPSDLYGLLYIPLDEIGNWKFSLVKELRAIGYQVDANKIL